ncbi:MAG: transporter substrate-binding domain-containing protein [Pirellulales bacterium]
MRPGGTRAQAIACSVALAMVVAVCLELTSPGSWTASAARADVGDAALSVGLTDEEQAWLKAHPTIRLAPDPDFPPSEYFDEQGQYQGITSEYVARIEQLLGIEFEIVHAKDWDEVLAMAQRREIDGITAASQTPSRSEYLLFTKPYLIFPAVIVVRNNVEGDLTPDDLATMSVAVVSGYSGQEYIERQYPDISLIAVPDTSTGLRRYRSAR